MLFVDDLNGQDSAGARRKEEETEDRERLLIKHKDDMRGVVKTPKDSTTMEILVPDGSAVYHPLIVPVNHDLNNDIYFIGKSRAKSHIDRKRIHHVHRDRGD